MKKSFKLQPVILSGGSGTRLWPLSRESFPKQYIKLNTSNKFSFIQKTLRRLYVFENIEDPIIICNEEQRFLVAEQMREINIKPQSIILEPFGKNTASAIAIAALKAYEKDKESILLILSSDHEIKNIVIFKKAIESGIQDAQEDKLVIFGVPPTYPETGFGYIETNQELSQNSFNSVPIKTFIEKPTFQKAQSLIKDNHFLWNSGIFLFKSKTILASLKEYEPKLLSFCQQALSKSSVDLDFLRLHKDSFGKCPNLSIDVAIMEKTKNVVVIPFSAGWSDLGNWKSLWDIENKDKDGKVIIGDIFTENVKNSYLHSKNSLLVGLGIENLIIVQTEDATLVANNKDAQEIKKLVSKLNNYGRAETKFHKKVYRPWGYYNLIEKGLNWQVKEICVNPKSSLSLQKHTFRSEHWIILEGKATVKINEIKNILSKNQSTYIPIGAKHRLSNYENTHLKLIEVQCGTYLGEDDIFRFEDNYGRINE